MYILWRMTVMSETILVSARVSSEVANRLASLSKSTHRSKSFLASQAIEEFLNVQEWHVEAIKEGIAAAKKGDVKSHEEAIAILNTWGKNA
jgi:RHH-type rel operon transcriptional repressor/antitoxin RelB